MRRPETVLTSGKRLKFPIFGTTERGRTSSTFGRNVGPGLIGRFGSGSRAVEPHVVVLISFGIVACAGFNQAIIAPAVMTLW